MKGYIVCYKDSWANDANIKVIGQFSSWKLANEVAVKFIKSLRIVYIVETEINKSITPVSDVNCWITDHTHYIVTNNDVKKYEKLI